MKFPFILNLIQDDSVIVDVRYKIKKNSEYSPHLFHM